MELTIQDLIDHNYLTKAEQYHISNKKLNQLKQMFLDEINYLEKLLKRKLTKEELLKFRFCKTCKWVFPYQELINFDKVNGPTCKDCERE